jgi:hypothetical protein
MLIAACLFFAVRSNNLYLDICSAPCYDHEHRMLCMPTCTELLETDCLTAARAVYMLFTGNSEMDMCCVIAVDNLPMSVDLNVQGKEVIYSISAYVV